MTDLVVFVYGIPVPPRYAMPSYRRSRRVRLYLNPSSSLPSIDTHAVFSTQLLAQS